MVKKQKSEVNYSLGHKESHCGKVADEDKGYCKNFDPPASCDKVAGRIGRPYWCKLFEKAK